MSMVQQQHTDQFLLTTKLSIPHIHAGLVARPRLFEQLQMGMQQPLALNPAPVNLITVLLATNLLGDLQVVRGNLHEAVAIYQDVLRRADERPIWQVAEAHIGLWIYFANGISWKMRHNLSNKL
jgi:hypothetical protein